MKSQESSPYGSKLQKTLHEIASEDEDEEGITNKKPINLKVYTNKKASAKNNVPRINLQNRRPSTLVTK